MKKDPNRADEAQKYEEPIASRDWILELLKEQDQPLSREDIAEITHTHGAKPMDALRRRLRAMVRDGQVTRSRRGLFSPCFDVHEFVGDVKMSRDGNAYVISPQDTRVILSDKQIRAVFPGDTIKVKVITIDGQNRYIGQIDDVVKRKTKEVIGRLNKEYDAYYVEPEKSDIRHKILVMPDDIAEATRGDIVVCEITAQPTRHTQAVGKIINVLGDAIDAKTAINAAVDAFDLPHEFSEAVASEAAEFADHVTDDDMAGREDIRELPLLTIDGEDAKDFDDAVYCERTKSGGWRLIVAIADVSHYVKPSAPLDKEAYNRGTSVYFPDYVVPMLPESLSNGLCSLKPKVDRLCLACDMQISKKGELKKFDFYPAVMHSHARLTYDKVHEILTQDTTPLHQEFADVLPHIHELNFLYEALKVARRERGAIEFETVETKILFDDNGRINEFGVYTRNDAHCLIEECMLMANISAAKFLLKAKQGGIYRIHESPKPEKIDDLKTFLKLAGVPFKAKGIPDSKDLSNVLKETRGRPDANMIQTMVLRSMNQAQYSPDNVGHFGLAFEAYSHFTSPIRRYPDLIVHRLIKANLKKPGGQLYGGEGLFDMAGHSSTTERRAEEATRDVIGALKCAYMKQHVGDDFTGIISGVTNFGFFVTLDQIPVDGLVHVSSIGDDFYHFDSGRQVLQGERHKKTYKLGDSVNIKLSRVDIAGRKIDFDLRA